MLKEWMSEISYNPPDKLISATSELIASFPNDQFVSVYKNWIKRLNWVIKYRREYYGKWIKLHYTNCYIDRNRMWLRPLWLPYTMWISS
jgi:hypothetical protein